MFASMLGTILVFVLAFFFFFAFVMLVIAGLETDKTETIRSNTVLEIKLDHPLPDRTLWEPFSAFRFSFNINRQSGLNEVLDNIRKGASDNNIRGIFLDLNNFSAGGIATVEAVRNELIKFKRSGKFIIAYGDVISQSAYYLASAADKIYMPPTGMLEFRGAGAELIFFKNTLDKLEIEPQIFQYGKYKSAIEPFHLDKMSPENREATTGLLKSINDHVIRGIAGSRSLDESAVRNAAENYLIRFPEDAVRLHFIDSMVYYDQVLEKLKSMSGYTKDRLPRTVSIYDYTNVKAGRESSRGEKIAVIFASGDIVNGEGSETQIGIDNITEAIRRCREDESIKAIVMRVNSPGGDALVSDLIWREVTLAKKKKPFVVSMGNYAASGGYYISCAADSIVAEPNTITGSIGVFGIIPNMQKFFKDKLGITFDRVTTGKYSDIGTVTRPLTADEKAIIQREIDRVYETFVKKCAEGRRKSFDDIHKIAQGRVWSGIQAKEIGLVDRLGGLGDAIRMAAKMAKLKEYKTVEYPGVKPLFEKIMRDFASEAEAKFIQYRLGENYKYFEKIEKLNSYNGIMARMPFEMDIH